MNEFLKALYYKIQNNVDLTDSEVIEGARGFKELARDLNETFAWAEAGAEAQLIADKLELAKTLRGIE